MVCGTIIAGSIEQAGGVLKVLLGSFRMVVGTHGESRHAIEGYHSQAHGRYSSWSQMLDASFAA